ncbi:MAG: invasion associated locus B family protein [Pseudomonadota bacterium]
MRTVKWSWLVLCGVVFAQASWAQDAEDADDAAENWVVYVEENPLSCWVVAAPSSTENSRDGESVAVNRGDTLFFVSYWPEQRRLGEVSFTGGYPFEERSVRIEIGEQSFDFFSEGEMAWALSEAQDGLIVDAMRTGSDAVMVGRSTRGTDTRDTFSLDGFTAAISDAEARCGS